MKKPELTTFIWAGIVWRAEILLEVFSSSHLVWVGLLPWSTHGLTLVSRICSAHTYWLTLAIGIHGRHVHLLRLGGHLGLCLPAHIHLVWHLLRHHVSLKLAVAWHDLRVLVWLLLWLIRNLMRLYIRLRLSKSSLGVGLFLSLPSSSIGLFPLFLFNIDSNALLDIHF